MKKTVKMAFKPEVIEVDIDDIQPLKTIKASIKKSAKYRQVLTSVREVGVIEHLIVYRLEEPAGKFLLLDGHLCMDVLKFLGEKTAHCLVATDDEGFTYNHKISRLSPIQEHFMILKAVDKGVSEDRIAKTLDVDVSLIRRKRNLLNDIKIVKESYGKDILNLVLACGYLSRIFENGKVIGFLSSHYPDILGEFQKIIVATSLST